MKLFFNSLEAFFSKPSPIMVLNIFNVSKSFLENWLLVFRSSAPSLEDILPKKKIGIEKQNNTNPKKIISFEATIKGIIIIIGICIMGFVILIRVA